MTKKNNGNKINIGIIWSIPISIALYQLMKLFLIRCVCLLRTVWWCSFRWNLIYKCAKQEFRSRDQHHIEIKLMKICAATTHFHWCVTLTINANICVRNLTVNLNAIERSIFSVQSFSFGQHSF